MGGNGDPPLEEQLRSAYPAGAITRIQVLEYGDDTEVEPDKTAMRAFFDWPGRTEGKKADPKTMHAFVYGNGAAITKLDDELPPSLDGSSCALTGWAERPEMMAWPSGSVAAEGRSCEQPKCECGLLAARMTD